MNSTLDSQQPTDDIIPPDSPERDWSSIIGIATAIGGNVLIALALNVQRFAHIKLHQERAQIKARVRQAQRRAKLLAIREQHETHDFSSAGDVLQRISHNRATDSDHIDFSSIVGYGTVVPSPPAASGSPRTSVDSERLEDFEDESPALSEKNPSLSYLRSPYWWLGQVLITLGEMGNFLAYGFAPASIVSPLGVVALVSNCVIAPILFHEKFRARDFWGVVIAVAGVVVVVLSSAGDESKLGPHDVWDAITALAFEVYLCVTVAMIATLMWASKRYGKRTILIDLGLVGLFGGYTALATKGVSSMLSSTLLGAFQTSVTWVLLFVLIATAVMQIRYLNRALQRFDSTQVIPIQFVMFTLCVIVGSAILYRDFERTTVAQSIKFISGCLLTFFGVFLITSGRPKAKDEENQLLDAEGIDETIGLASHEAYSDITPPDTPRSSTSSRPSSRSNFPAFQSERRISLAYETGFPSTRVPVRHSNETPRAAIPNIWEDYANTVDNPPPHPESTPLQPGFTPELRSTSTLSDPPFFEPSMPPNHGYGPFHSHSHTMVDSHVTSAPSRPPSRRFAGPVISASPFSSAVSAVMSDTLRRNPLTHRTSLGRIRQSIRQSMFMDDYDDEDQAVDTMLTREPLLGPLVETAETSNSQRPGTSRERSFNPTGTKNRHRSLSDTLGGLFAPRKNQQDDVLDQSTRP